MKVKFAFLQQLIHHWDHVEQAFKVSFNSWYQPIEEDINFITKMFRMGDDWTQFLEFPIGVSVETQLIYVQRYVCTNKVEPTEFWDAGGQLRIDSFCREEVRCLPIIVTELEHYTSYGSTSISLLCSMFMF